MIGFARAGLGMWVMAALVMPQAAGAHAALTGSAPSADSVVNGSPGVVELTFSEKVEPKFSRIAVIGPDGHAVDKHDTHAVGDARHLAVSVKPMLPGAYKVNWTATAVDTHRTSGSFGFSVAQ